MPNIPGFDIQDGTPPVRQSPLHFHHAFEVGFVAKGTAGVTGFGERRIVGGDAYTLMPPGQVHSASWESERPEPCVFFLSPALVDEARSCVTKRGASYRDFSGHSVDVVRGLKSAYEAVIGRAPILEQQERLLEAIVHIEERRSSVEIKEFKPEPAAVRVVRDYLESHFLQNVTLEQLTALTPLTRFHVLRVFRRAMGLPPHAYLTRLRLLHAQTALRSGTPISVAASDAGFADQSHLTRCFKRCFQVTPGEYLRQSALARMPSHRSRRD